MTRRINHQFTTIWLVLNEQQPASDPSTPEQDALETKAYDLWSKGCTLVDHAQHDHPFRWFQEKHGDDTLNFDRWEFCDQEGLTEVIDDKLVWPVAFYHAAAFEPEALAVLRNLCIEQFQAACAGTADTARFVRQDTTTEYVESITDVVLQEA